MKKTLITSCLMCGAMTPTASWSWPTQVSNYENAGYLKLTTPVTPDYLVKGSARGGDMDGAAFVGSYGSGKVPPGERGDLNFEFGGIPWDYHLKTLEVGDRFSPNFDDSNEWQGKICVGCEGLTIVLTAFGAEIEIAQARLVKKAGLFDANGRPTATSSLLIEERQGRSVQALGEYWMKYSNPIELWDLPDGEYPLRMCAFGPGGQSCNDSIEYDLRLVNAVDGLMVDTFGPELNGRESTWRVTYSDDEARIASGTKGHLQLQTMPIKSTVERVSGYSDLMVNGKPLRGPVDVTGGTFTVTMTDLTPGHHNTVLRVTNELY